MARYYKYKSADDLQVDASRFGEDLPLTSDTSLLFQPVSIGSLSIGNRLCIQPMEGCDGTLDGRPDDLTFRRYRRFGAGGAKLIWGEATAIDEAARMNPRQLWIHDGTATALEEMLAGCRHAHRDAFGSESGLAVGLQLTHSGRFSYRRPQLAVHDPMLDPLTLDKSTGRRVDSSYPLLTDDDLRRIEDQYVTAARLAARIGCDFVDIKQCHRYLLSELLAASHRLGDYGGSLENRTRLVRNVIGRIRSEVPGLVIVSRVNVYDGIPYVRRDRWNYTTAPQVATDPSAAANVGLPVPHDLPLQAAFGVDRQDHRKLDLSEPLQLVKWLRDWGVAAINVSMGNPYANPHVVRPAEFPPVDGYDAPEHPLIGVLRHFGATAAVQAALPDFPVVGSGYSWLQDFAMQAGAGNVRENRCSMVGIGRASLSHPDFARHLLEHGTLNRKLICRTFSYCTNLMRAKDHPLGQYPTGCPPFDKEIYGPQWKEIETQRSGREQTPGAEAPRQ
ncbi:MAG: NADH:flavin oxidoreductase [Planctomycetes bacterium]|nr:NADH:flavin oxidoreductase [Planctomycetota bacterium]